MPIEINELHIKVNVKPDEDRGDSVSAGKKKENQDLLIQTCVEQVMEIIDRKNQR